MGKHDHKQISTFLIEGRFLGFLEDQEGKRKSILLATEQGEMTIKLAKPLRWSVGPELRPGQRLQVGGEQKEKHPFGFSTEVKRKAWSVEILESSPREDQTSEMPQATRPSCILICQKSDCQRRGSQSVLRALETALSGSAEADRVQIRPTGCMKDCKAGPHLVFMPGRVRLHQVTPQDVPHLLEKYFL